MNQEFITALSVLEEKYGITKPNLLLAIEKALLASYKKKYSTDVNVQISMNSTTGSIRVISKKLVVEDIIDERLEIEFNEAREIDANCEIDGYIECEIKPADFGRIAINVAKQVIREQIKLAENNAIHSTYQSKEDDLVSGSVIGQDTYNYYIRLDNIEAILPKNETMQCDDFKLHQEISAYMAGFENHSKQDKVILSRTHPGYLKKLMELNIPGIAAGNIIIHSIAREAGHRSKVAVATSHPDFIGHVVEACVSTKESKGALIQSVVEQLGVEKIDIIEWFEKPESYIESALKPARILKVHILDEENARVLVPEDQLTLAIGIKGQNVRLAARLTGYKIDLYSDAFSDSFYSTGGK